MVPEHARLLFWDIETDSFDPIAYPVYTIERVLEHGDEDAVHWMRRLFSDAQIREVLRTTRRLTPLAANFWALVFGVPHNDVVHLELRRTLVSFLYYPYPLVFPLLHFAAMDVADARDIACMKISAIASRGSRRDFIDLHVAAGMYGLRDILAWFDEKYAGTPHNRVHLLKALTYFDDAELEPMPDMLVPLDWPAVKAFFTREVPRLL